jgi:sulfite exporter TauE/SafE
MTVFFERKYDKLCLHHHDWITSAALEELLVNILLAFVTGLTTGGLSCLAVQGGLLASSLAGQIEKDFTAATGKNTSARKKRGSHSRPVDRSHLALPILAFLAAKLLAYTLLGALLGLAGQMFQLSPLTRAALQIGIGIFMLGTALRMLNVHPIFRYFAIEPPAFLRRKLRKTASGADGSTLVTPIFLGLLTVLIPCGVTQAMMAAALSSADPLTGAALMAAFTLGASPVFFAVAYFATRLGARLEKHFMRFVAVVVLILAVLTIDTGVTLAGSPISITRAVSRIFSPPPAAVAQQAAPSAAGGSVITINVYNTAYSPDVIHAKAGEPLQLRLVTENVRSCSRAFVIPAINVQRLLDTTGEATVDIPAQEKGTEMPFACSMGMYTGIIIFDL